MLVQYRDGPGHEGSYIRFQSRDLSIQSFNVILRAVFSIDRIPQYQEIHASAGTFLHFLISILASILRSLMKVAKENVQRSCCNETLRVSGTYSEF